MAHMIECNRKIRGDLGSVWLVIEIFDFQCGQVVGIGGFDVSSICWSLVPTI